MGGGSCRSQLAGDGISSILQTKPVAGIAGKPAPTMVALMEADLVGACLLAMGSAQSCRQTGCRHRWQASSHNGGFDGGGPCRSQLADDEISSILQANPVAGIAGKPAPTMVALMGAYLVGASLLAMGSAQSCRQTRLPASLASQLPQWWL